MNSLLRGFLCLLLCLSLCLCLFATAFAANSDSTSITVPKSVTEIAEEAFMDCNSITSIVIPTSVSIIGDRAFSGCSGLKDVYYGGMKEQWNTIIIGSDNGPLTKANLHFTPVSKLSFATGGISGNFYGLGSAIADVLNEKFSDRLRIKVYSTGGSKANIQMLNSGDVDIAFAQSDMMSYAYTGTGCFADNSPITNYSAVASFYPSYVHIVAKKDITSIDQLEGRLVSVGDAGSSTLFNSEQILSAYDLTFDDIRFVNMGKSDALDSLKRGTIDAAFIVADFPDKDVTELAESFDFNLLPVDEDHAAKLRNEHEFYYFGVIPADNYRAITEDVPAIAVMNTIIASNSVSEDVIYSIVKGMVNYKNEIAVRHAKGSEFSFNTALSGVSIPWHDGAVKYYKEQGLM